MVRKSTKKSVTATEEYEDPDFVGSLGGLVLIKLKMNYRKVFRTLFTDLDEDKKSIIP